MSKFSRRERKLIKELSEEAKALGYAQGYADGLRDGNPFTPIIEAMKRVVDSLNNEEVKKLLEASEDKKLLEASEEHDCSEVDV